MDKEERKVEAFKKYLKNYDITQDRIALKVRHTYGVVEFSEWIARKLELEEEDVELAKLIAYLHDIGRFEQAKQYDDFTDGEKMDHAQYGVKILFEEGLIRDFITEDKFDNIIYKAIFNHNRYKIEEGLNPRELLHAKIIRDSDKLDNFQIKQTQSFYTLYRKTEEEVSKQFISEKVYESFLQHQCILSADRKTDLDHWISILGFIYDLNFKISYKYLYQEDAIFKLVDRISYQQEDTKKKMEEIKKVANQFLENKLKE